MKKQYELVAAGYVNSRSIDGVIWSKATAAATRNEVANQIRVWRSRGLTIVRSNTELLTKEFPNVFYRTVTR